MRKRVFVMVVFLVLLTVLSLAPVFAGSEITMGVQFSGEDQQLVSPVISPVDILVKAPDGKNLCFGGNDNPLSQIIFQGLDYFLSIVICGIKNLLGVDLCFTQNAGINPKGVPNNEWKPMVHVGGMKYRFQGNTRDLPVGKDHYLFRILHEDEKHVRRYLFGLLKSVSYSKGQIMTLYVLNVQEAPPGFETMPREVLYTYTSGFIPAWAVTNNTKVVEDWQVQVREAARPKIQFSCVVGSNGVKAEAGQTKEIELEKGQIAELSWGASDNSQTVKLDGVDKDKKDTIKVQPQTTTIYKLEAVGKYETVSACIKLIVKDPPPVKAATPTIKTFCKKGYGPVEVTITSAQHGVMCYTTDGTEPTAASTQYDKSFIVDKNCTVKARTFIQGYLPSDVAMVEITVQPPPPPPKADKAIITANSTPGGGAVCVAMSSPIPRAVIRYTTDGSEPNENSTVYTGVIFLRQTATIKTRVYADGYLPSDVETRTNLVEPAAVQSPKSPPSQPPTEEEPDPQPPPKKQETGEMELRLSAESAGFEVIINNKIIATVLGKDLEDVVDFANRDNVIIFDHLTGIVLTNIPVGVLRINFLDEDERWRIRRDQSDPYFTEDRYVRWNLQPGQQLKIFLERGNKK